MQSGKWKHAAWALPTVALVLVGLLYLRDLQRSLEAQARAMQWQSMLERVGLRGRIVLLHWNRARLLVLPRPALALEDVDFRVLSGQPGSGAASAHLSVDRLRLVPGWEYLRHRRLDRVEVAGGLLELGSDIAPQLPRDYLDPLEGTRRPVPWSVLLAVMADSVARKGPVLPRSASSDAECSPSPQAPVPASSSSAAAGGAGRRSLSG